MTGTGSTSVPHHMRRAKAFFAFALLFVYSAEPGSFVNDGEAVHFIVDKACRGLLFFAVDVRRKPSWAIA